MKTTALMRIGGAPAPDPARVDVIRGAMDLSDLTFAQTFGERARRDLLNITEGILAETRTGDLGECSNLLTHVRDRLSGLDPLRLEKRRGMAGWFENRKRKLRAFRTEFTTTVDAMLESAGGVVDRATSIGRRSRTLESLWADARAAILEVDAYVDAGLARLAAEPVAPDGQDRAAHPLAARLALLIAVRNAAVRQLPLVRLAQNADRALPDRLKTLAGAVADWRDAWRDGLGLNRKRPKTIRPDLSALTRDRDALAWVLDEARRDLAEARARRTRAQTRMEQVAENVRRAA